MSDQRKVYWKTEKKEEKWKLVDENSVPVSAMFSTISSFGGEPSDKNTIRYEDYTLDIDAKTGVDDKSTGENLESCRQCTIKVVEKLVSTGINANELKFYFSGSKGYHIIVPREILGSENGHILMPLISKKFDDYLFPAKDFPEFDRSLRSMGKGKMFRIPNRKRHNGLHKIRISYNELVNKSMEELFIKAKSTTDDSWTPWTPKLNTELNTLYKKFTKEVEDEQSQIQSNIMNKTSVGEFDKDSLPSCLMKILASDTKLNEDLSFNELVFACLIPTFKKAGLDLGDALAMEELTTWLENFEGSTTYTDYQSKHDHFTQAWAHDENNTKEFSCGEMIRACGVDSSMCNSCKPNLKEMFGEYGEEITDEEWAALQEVQDAEEDIFVEDPKDEPIEFILRKLLKVKDIKPSRRKRLIMKILNKGHAYIIVGGKSFVVHDNGDEIQLLPKQVFEDKYITLQTEGETPTGRKKKIGVGEFWFHNDDRKVVNKLVFKPEMACADDEYNLWKGFAIRQEMELTRAYDQCKNFLYHVKEVICGNDETSYKYLMSWLAHMIQKPWEKPGVAIILKSGEGTGKNTFTRVLGQIVGNKHYLETSSREVILGQFNAATEGKILINLSEAIWAGDKRLIGALKTLITDMDRSIERKGVDAYMIQCFCRVMMSSNEDWVIPASADSRRFFVLDVSDKHKQNIKYFETLNKDIDSGVAEAFYTILKHWEITENVRVAPTTDALIEQRERSMDVVELFWSEILDDGVFPNVGQHYIGFNDKEDHIAHCDGPDWPDYIHLGVLHESFSEWCTKRKTKCFLGKKFFNRKILTLMGKTPNTKGRIRELEIRKRLGNERTWVLDLPELESCMNYWDSYLGKDSNKN